ncbi:MAG: heavy-metal-associated domain-containing protein, partial [Bifidobacteriaceae bacterium]|nr:heavy-metal-associated domain-containing protein [Bifidobacteriaceae bacterium]
MPRPRATANAPADPNAPAATSARTRTTVPVTGMTCKACEARVAKALKKVKGVEQATVWLAKGEAAVVSRGPVSQDRLAAALKGAGYQLGREALPLVTREGTAWRDALIG